MKPAAAFRRLLSDDAIIVAPGVYDGLSARLAARAGFRAVYAKGAASPGVSVTRISGCSA